MDTNKVGWECGCGKEFVGVWNLPWERIHEHVVGCNEAPELLASAINQDKED